MMLRTGSAATCTRIDNILEARIYLVHNGNKVTCPIMLRCTSRSRYCLKVLVPFLPSIRQLHLGLSQPATPVVSRVS
jgi:hypothetical protein